MSASRCVSTCGIAFSLTMLTSVTWTVSSIIHPFLYEEKFSADLFLTFLFVNVVWNLYLIKSTSSKNHYINENSSLPDITWQQCVDCVQYTPPRSHHCPLCNVCILKRDHHCFFTGCCIGFYNQRYFIVFCFYVGIGSMYCSYCLVLYATNVLDLSLTDFLIPWTFIRYVYGVLCVSLCIHISLKLNE